MTGTTPSAAAHPLPAETAPLWRAPFAERPVDATVTVPGSKSLTNRYLVLAALADGPSRLRAPLHSRDSALMIEALRQLGATITEVPGDGAFGPDLEITPISLDAPAADTAIDCGLAGTVMRFVPPRRGPAPGSVTVRRRPARAQAADGHHHRGPDRTRRSRQRARRRAGVVTAVHRPGHGRSAGRPPRHRRQRLVPVRLRPAAGRRPLHRGSPPGTSSRDTPEPVPSLDHINMTVAVLRGVGVAVDDSVPNHWVVSPGPIRAFDQRIEQDLSNAGPFLAAALATRGTVRIPELARGNHAGRRPLARHPDRHGRDRDADGRHPDRHRRARDQGRRLRRDQRTRPHRRRALRPRRRPLTAERHRPPPRARNGPARRPRGRDQPPGRRRRGDRRRPASSAPHRCTAASSTATPTTAWPPQAPSSAWPCTASRSRTSRPRPRPCRTSRSSGKPCWPSGRTADEGLRRWHAALIPGTNPTSGSAPTKRAPGPAPRTGPATTTP